MQHTEEQEKIYYYSLNPEITGKQLKNSQTPENDPIRKEKLIKRMNKYHLQGITENDKQYPIKLKIISGSPYLLYYQGNIDILNKKILGIVGPRQMSSYAEQVLEELFTHLATKEVITVSGLARGIDQKCHRLSIKYNIPTIAVLGGGFRKYLEGEERHLMQEITENGGCIISEFKLNFQPTNRSFPQRNRLIAGLADLIFIPEAKESSGSLITAEFAHKYKKKILVTPNNIFAQNGKGSNLLIAQKKAEMVTDFSQISNFFQDKTTKNYKGKESKEDENLTENEIKILKLLKEFENRDYSHRIDKTGISQAEVLSILTILEIKGKIYQNNPGIYAVKN